MSRIFPQQGRAWNRWWKIRKTLIEKQFETDHILKGPVTLFDMNRPEDVVDAMAVGVADKGGWRISDDEVIGGFSRGYARLIRTSNDYTNFLQGKEPLSMDDEDAESKTERQPEDSGNFEPFLRWNGTLDTSVGEDSRVARSGFCALRSPIFPFEGIDLGNKYNALELTCRSDGRVYTMNLKVSSYFPDDVYQALIDVPATHPNKNNVCDETGGDFVTLVMPFRDFLLTRNGRVTEVQRALDGGIRIQHIGLTLMDGENSDFEFDVARIRAINYYHGEILGETDEEAPY